MISPQIQMLTVLIQEDPPVQIPDIGADEVEIILDYASDLIGLIDGGDLLKIIAGFHVAIFVITALIRFVRNPPKINI